MCIHIQYTVSSIPFLPSAIFACTARSSDCYRRAAGVAFLLYYGGPPIENKIHIHMLRRPYLIQSLREYKQNVSNACIPTIFEDVRRRVAVGSLS